MWFWLVISTRPVATSPHRVVAAVVAEGQLERGPAQGVAQQLVAEADAEHRDPAQQVGDVGEWSATGAGSPGPLDRNTPSGWRASTSAAEVDAGHNLDVAEVGELVQDRGLDPEVEGDDAPARRCAGDEVRLGGGDLARRSRAVGSRPPPPRPARSSLAVAGAEGGGHGAVRRRWRVSRRVSMPAMPGSLMSGRKSSSDSLRSPIRATPGQLADDEPPAKGRRLSSSVGVHAVVADVRVGEGDDLPRVGRVGDHLLIARRARC